MQTALSLPERYAKKVQTTQNKAFSLVTKLSTRILHKHGYYHLLCSCNISYQLPRSTVRLPLTNPLSPPSSSSLPPTCCSLFCML